MRYIRELLSFLAIFLLISSSGIFLVGAATADDNVTNFAIGPFNGSFNVGHPTEVMISGPNQVHHSERGVPPFTLRNGIAYENVRYTNFSEYVLQVGERTYPYGSFNIALDAYETNITYLKGAQTDFDSGLEEPPGGTANYTNQKIDGRTGVVMRGEQPFDNGNFYFYGAAFYITPKIVCFINAQESKADSLLKNRDDFLAAIKSIHVNFDGRDPSRFKKRQKLIGYHPPT